MSHAFIQQGNSCLTMASKMGIRILFQRGRNSYFYGLAVAKLGNSSILACSNGVNGGDVVA